MGNKKFISFNCEKHFYYFLIFWALELALKLFDNLFPTNFLEIKITFDNLDPNRGELESKKINELIVLICKILSKLFAGLVNLCYNEPILENIKKDKNKFFFLMITSILIIICKSRSFLYYLLSQCVKKLSDYEIDWEIGIYIIFSIFFCKYINKEITLYLHHKVSIAITLIAFAFMSSIDIYFLITKDHDIQVPNKIIFVILYNKTFIYFPPYLIKNFHFYGKSIK